MERKRYVVDLSIPPEELLRYYRGGVTGVVGRARSGQRLRFPVARLRPFVTRHGVQGVFVLEVDGGHRLLGISRLTSP